MKLPINLAWGKLSKDKSEWHPIIHHTLDVMAVAYEILPISFPYLDDTQIKQLLFFVGLHDIGKYNDGFQNKAISNSPTGHLKPAFSLLSEKHLEDILLNPLADFTISWFNDPIWLDALFKAVISHHGQPLNLNEFTIDDITCWQLPKHTHHVHTHLNILKDVLDLKQTTTLHLTNEFLFLFSGLVQFADWIGSNSFLFPYINIEHQSLENDLLNSCVLRFAFARKQANQFLKNLGWINMDKSYLKEILDTKDFSKILPFKDLYAYQNLIFDTELKDKIEILEIQTGGGKTEIALLRALQHYVAGNVNSIVFALPSIASARQIHQRLNDILLKAFPAFCPQIVLATSLDTGKFYHHIKKAESQINWDSLNENGIWDDTDPAHIYSKLWSTDYSKKFLSATFVICTIDQVLMAGLQIKHSTMLGFLLSRSFLIIDEVHASDTYAMKLLESILKDHGGRSLLLSATLTNDVKNRLLNLSHTNDVFSIPYPLFNQTPLPALEEKEFEVFLEHDLDYVFLSDMVLNMANKGNKVCVIKNTVRYCVEFQRVLEQRATSLGLDHLLFKVKGLNTPFHARYSTGSRLEITKQVEHTFDKHSKDKGMVIVATQVIQQSLDIDFDYMVTDLCPMDLLIQRAGRLQRHKKTRQTKLACLVVLTPVSLVDANRNTLNSLGIGTIYKNFVQLEAVLINIKENSHFEINKQSRWRIENTLGKGIAEDYVFARIGKDKLDILKEKSKASNTEEHKHKALAMDHLYSRSFDYLTFAYNPALKNIKTRIGEDTIVIHFKDANGEYLHLEDIFGGFFNTLTVQLRDLNEKGLDLTKEIIGLAVRDQNKIFDVEYVISIASSVFTYTRFGLLKIS